MVTQKRNPDDGILDTFGKRLKAARERKGLTQEALASLLSGSERGRKQTVADWEADKGMPRGDTVVQLAGHLDVTAEWLVTGVRSEGYGNPEPDRATTLSRQIDEVLNGAGDMLEKAALIAEITAAYSSISRIGESDAATIRARAMERAEERALLRERRAHPSGRPPNVAGNFTESEAERRAASGE